MGARAVAAYGALERVSAREEEEQNVESKYKYERVATDASIAGEEVEESDPELEQEIANDNFKRQHSDLEAHLRSFQKSNRGRVVTMGLGIMGVLLFLYWAVM
jgi:hypothetical protein